MPALDELRNTCSPSGILLEALQRFERKTGRNVVLCHSGFLKVQSVHVTIMHEDMEAYMNAFNGLDKRKGLDVILHTPGGYVDAAEGIGNYWRSVFFGNVEAYIPHLAFSCGTLLAFACKTIHMTKASGLGPVDPAVLLFQRVDHGFQFLADKHRNDGGRRLVRAQTMVVARAGDGKPQKILVFVHRLDDGNQKQHELPVFGGRAAGVEQVQSCR